MSFETRATQTASADFLQAIQLRLEHIKLILQENENGTEETAARNIVNDAELPKVAPMEEDHTESLVERPGDSKGMNEEEENPTVSVCSEKLKEDAEKVNNEAETLNETICIGSNKTQVDRDVFNRINWDCYSLATRALLQAVFDKETLATKTVSGVKQRKRSIEQMLDPRKVDDIIEVVKEKCNVEAAFIRRVIIVKCSDTSNSKRLKRKQFYDD